MPAPQATHVLEAVASVAAEKVPAAHRVHEVAPLAVWNCPAEHPVHVALAAAAYVPGEHGVHAVEAVCPELGEYVPATQLVQKVPPALPVATL